MYDFIFLTLIFGTFAFMIIEASLPRYWNGCQKTVVSLFLSVLIGLLCSYMIIENDVLQEETWNNGIHAECNGEWEFTNGSYYRGKTYYFYKCDKCGKVVEFNSNFTK